MKKSYLIATIILLAIFIASVFIWQKQKQSVVQEQKNQEEALVQTDAEQSIDTSDWKTYRNEEYSITFKYPNDIIVSDNIDSSHIFYIDIDSSRMSIVLNDLGTEKYGYAKKQGFCTGVTILRRNGEVCGKDQLDKEVQQEIFRSFVQDGTCLDDVGVLFFDPQYSNSPSMNNIFIKCPKTNQHRTQILWNIFQSIQFDQNQ